MAVETITGMPSLIYHGNKAYEPKISHDRYEIKERVEELGEVISKFNQHATKDNPLQLVCLLKGALPFFRDLNKSITVPTEWHMAKLSSYGEDMSSSGVIREELPLPTHLKDRRVVVVDEMLDTGTTLQWAVNKIGRKGHSPESLQVATLFRKPDNVKHPLGVDYVGFDIPNEFVVGYGMDLGESFRDLEDVYALNEVAGHAGAVALK